MYLLDANVFITAKNAHYGMDFVPAFWEWLQQAHDDGLVFSVEAVRDELVGGADELARWAQSLPATFFKAVDEAAVTELRKLASWASGHDQYTDAAKAEFLNSADYFLVGQAKALGYIVVTHERPAPDAKKRIRIPEACNPVGATYQLPWTMLRDQEARFVL
jgi:hypothetical protein